MFVRSGSRLNVLGICVVRLGVEHSPPDGPEHHDYVCHEGDKQQGRHDTVPQDISQGEQRHDAGQAQQAQGRRLGHLIEALPGPGREDQAQRKGTENVGDRAADNIADSQSRALLRQTEGHDGQLLPFRAGDQDGDEDLGQAETRREVGGAGHEELGAALQEGEAGDEGRDVEDGIEAGHLGIRRAFFLSMMKVEGKDSFLSLFRSLSLETPAPGTLK